MSHFRYCTLLHVLIAFLESGTPRARSTLTCCQHTRESMPAYLYHPIVNAHRNYSAVNQVSMVIPGPLSGQREFDAKASYCPCAPVPARQDCLVVVLQSTIIQCSRFRQYATSPGGRKGPQTLGSAKSCNSPRPVGVGNLHGPPWYLLAWVILVFPP